MDILGLLNPAVPFVLQAFVPSAVPPLLTNRLSGSIGLARFGGGVAPARFVSVPNATRNGSTPVGPR